MVEVDLLNDVSDDLKTVLLENIEGMVESHIEAWQERYFMKGQEEVETDLYVNHDPSLELERVEEELGRELTGQEHDIVETFFNENVIAKFPDNKN